MLRLVLFSAIIALSVAFDPLDSHGGVFRPLELTKSELKLVSRLHATASYHDLFEFIRNKLNTMPSVTMEERKRIEKFLLKNRPPTAIKSFLDDADRNYIAVLHAKGDIPESMSVVEQAILRLSKGERRKVVEYIWKNPETFMYEHFGLEP